MRLAMTYLRSGCVVSIMLQSVDEYNQWLPVLPFFQNVEREGVGIYG